MTSEYLLTLTPPRLPPPHILETIKELLLTNPQATQLDDIFSTYNFTPSLVAKMNASTFDKIKDLIRNEQFRWDLAWLNHYTHHLPILLGNDLLTLKDRAFLTQYPDIRNNLSVLFDLKPTNTLEEFLQNYRQRRFTPQCDLYCKLKIRNIEGAIGCGNLEYVLANMDCIRDEESGDLARLIILAIDKGFRYIADAILDNAGQAIGYLISTGNLNLLQYVIAYLGSERFVHYLELTDQSYTYYLRMAADLDQLKILKIFLRHGQHRLTFKDDLLRLARDASSYNHIGKIKLYLKFMDSGDALLLLTTMPKYSKTVTCTILESGLIPSLEDLYSLETDIELDSRLVAQAKKYFKRYSKPRP